MEPSIDQMASKLAQRNIRSSYQRLKVLQYLIENPSHPTADQIYTDLQAQIPTLSRTTIYNTLAVFEQAGLVRVLTIENHEARYDILVENQGHFQCVSCGSIIDFTFDFKALVADDLAGFKIQEKNVYFKGTCPRCLANINKPHEEE